MIVCDWFAGEEVAFESLLVPAPKPYSEDWGLTPGRRTASFKLSSEKTKSLLFLWEWERGKKKSGTKTWNKFEIWKLWFQSLQWSHKDVDDFSSIKMNPPPPTASVPQLSTHHWNLCTFQFFSSSHGCIIIAHLYFYHCTTQERQVWCPTPKDQSLTDWQNLNSHEWPGAVRCLLVSQGSDASTWWSLWWRACFSMRTEMNVSRPPPGGASGRCSLLFTSKLEMNKSAGFHPSPEDLSCWPLPVECS